MPELSVFLGLMGFVFLACGGVSFLSCYVFLLRWAWAQLPARLDHELISDLFLMGNILVLTGSAFLAWWGPSLIKGG